MTLSIERGKRLARLAVALGRTWRFRDAADPAARGQFPDTHAIYATWHEYTACCSLLGRGRGLATLASLNRDGEIISHVLHRLGVSVIRGSTSRGAAAGYRELIRAVEGGVSVCLTMDGPRGPRHVCQPGTVRLAARTGRPIVPTALAATSGWRLSSWDRFLVPAPGSRIIAAFGDPIDVPADANVDAVIEHVERATMEQAHRAEAIASEARWGRAYRTRRLVGESPSSTAGGTDAPRGTPSRAEARARRAWRGRPPVDLRVASGVYVCVREARHALYDVGLVRSRRAPIPVISVGGLTVGGSGKTPLASEIAGWLIEAGRSPGILTRGYADELLLHAALQPGVGVWGHPDRAALARRAAARSDVALLDDGFQHRRLARDLEIVAIDRDALRRTNGRPLPAGPFRDSLRRLRRDADRAVLLGREPRTDEVAAWEEEWLDRHGRGLAVAVASFAHEEAHVALRGTEAVSPTVALTGTMKPNLFFDFARHAYPSISREHALTDHGVPGSEWRDVVAAAREGGFVMTLKDYVRLKGFIPDDVPVRVVGERIVWHSGRGALLDAVLATAERRG